jgi:hypothetical protein
MANITENYSKLEVYLLFEFLPPKTAFNSKKDCKTLQKLHEAIKQKTPG